MSLKNYIKISLIFILAGFSSIQNANAQKINFYIDSFVLNGVTFIKKNHSLNYNELDSNYLFERFEKAFHKKYVSKKIKKYPIKKSEECNAFEYDNISLNTYSVNKNGIKDIEVVQSYIYFNRSTVDSLNFSILDKLVTKNSTYNDIFNDSLLNKYIDKKFIQSDSKNSLFLIVGEYTLLLRFNEDEYHRLKQIDIVF
jgi:hypothetical protein